MTIRDLENGCQACRAPLYPRSVRREGARRWAIPGVLVHAGDRLPSSAPTGAGTEGIAAVQPYMADGWAGRGCSPKAPFLGREARSYLRQAKVEAWIRRRDVTVRQSVGRSMLGTCRMRYPGSIGWIHRGLRADLRRVYKREESPRRRAQEVVRECREGLPGRRWRVGRILLRYTQTTTRYGDALASSSSAALFSGTRAFDWRAPDSALPTHQRTVLAFCPGSFFLPVSCVHASYVYVRWLRTARPSCPSILSISS